MKLVITGASGNVGTALLRLLADADDISSVRGVASHAPPPSTWPYDRVDWTACDLRDPSCVGQVAKLMRGATAVVHLAWDILGAHRRGAQRRTNVTGTGHVLSAAAESRVGHLVHLSSVAAYAPNPTRGGRVNEDWPLGGIPGSAYSADKVAVERLLDGAQTDHPDLRIARLRPPAILQPEAASELTRYVLGRLAPAVRYRWLRPPVLPLPPVTMQLVHAADVAQLILQVLRAGATGAYNVAGEPLLREQDIAASLHMHRLPTPERVLRSTMDATAAARLQPLDGSWWDMLTQVPLVSTSRAREELGWRPVHPAADTLAAVREAAITGTGAPSPRLAPS